MRIRRKPFELGMFVLAVSAYVCVPGCDRSSSEEKKPSAPPSLAEIPKGESKPSGASKPAGATTPSAAAKPETAPDSGAASKPASAPGAGSPTAPSAPPDPHAGLTKPPAANPHANIAGAPPAGGGAPPADGAAPRTGSAAPKAQADVAGSSLTLVGITMTIPDGWVHEPTPSGPMAAAAVFRLPKADGDADDGTVRVTFFPNMKGMDDSNIQRWLGQVTKADGSPATMTDAKLTTAEMGAVKVKMLDVSGNVKATMRAEPVPNGRMLAAIVDHPEGPHFVVAAGASATMKRWETAIDAFVKSAKVK